MTKYLNRHFTDTCDIYMKKITSLPQLYLYMHLCICASVTTYISIYLHIYVICPIDSLYLENSEYFIHQLYDSFHSDIHPREKKAYAYNRNLNTNVLQRQTALLVITQNQKQPKCPSIDKSMVFLKWYVHTMEY